MSEEIMKKQKLNQCFYRYVGYLDSLAESREKAREESKRNEREIIAHFRESVRTGSPIEIFKYIQKFFDELPEDLSRFERTKIEDSYLLVAGLFGLYPSISRHKADKYSNLGTSLSEYEKEISGGKGKPSDDQKISGTERRFLGLLRANEEDLPQYLRQTIQLLESKKISINWLQLLKDVRNWSSDKKFVQRSWAREFWKTTNKKEENEEGEE